MKEALKLALEALEAMQSYAAAERKGLLICDEAITAIKAALAQEQEPVAWMDEDMDCIFFDTERPEPFSFDFWKPLYTTPPQRKPLTDEQISLIAHNIDSNDWNDLNFKECWHEGFKVGFREAEIEYNIKGVKHE